MLEYKLLWLFSSQNYFDNIVKYRAEMNWAANDSVKAAWADSFEFSLKPILSKTLDMGGHAIFPATKLHLLFLLWSILNTQ